MVVLVADVGGTNTRLALAEGDGRICAGPQRFRNDDHADFLSVAAAYRESIDAPSLTGACIAIAGPVAGTSARLTNRDWSFDSPRIGAVLGTPNVHLLNDIVALGYCLGGLSEDQIGVVRAGQPLAGGQKLVVGIGTGANGCVVRDVGGRAAVLEAELGHGTLPLAVMDRLVDELGDEALTIPSTEELFSGRGLARLHLMLTGERGVEAGEVVARAAADPDHAAAETMTLLAELTGLLVRQLYFYYLPAGGVYFAGSVARSVLQRPGLARFETALCGDGPFADRLNDLPVSLITDDAAALAGCARVLL